MSIISWILKSNKETNSRSNLVALQPGGMVAALFNYKLPHERIMIASDLAFFDERIVWEALLHIASDPLEESGLREKCGESLGEIFWRNQIMDERIVNLTVEARRIFDVEYGNLIKASPDGPPNRANEE